MQSYMLREYAKRLTAFPVNQFLKRRTRHEPIRSRYKRVYCYHIRKTGGTSLHRAFLSLGGEDSNVVHERLLRSLTYHTTSGGFTFVGHNKYLIEAGHYFYGFSHHPAHALNIPDETFTITILRDPAKRVISHYKMLKHLAVHHPDHEAVTAEGQWLGDSFDDFISNIPDRHLLRQLYMFSKVFDIDEALHKIQNCNHVFFTKDFAGGVHALSEKINVELPVKHVRKSSNDLTISDHEQTGLREKLEPEYRLMSLIRTSSNLPLES